MLPSEQLQEQSEKDMIGSLLDEDEDLPASLMSQRLSKRNSTRTSDGVFDQISMRNRQTSFQEHVLLDGLVDFPTIALPTSQLQLTSCLTQGRVHSMSHEDIFYYTPNQSPLIRDRLRSQGIDDWVSQCKDQHDSLTVQKKFEMGTEQQKQKIFKSIESEISTLARHRYGNYVIQKIIEKGTNEMRAILLQKMQDQWLGLTLDKFGCRVVQKQLDHICNQPHFYNELLNALSTKTLALIFDQCGNHVLQKVMEVLPHERTSFIIKVVEDNVENVVSHSYGCRIAQKCLETYSSEQLQHLYQILLPLTEQLTFCQYGNYIVQHMIQGGPSETCLVINQLFYSRLLEICKDKYASNVAQKFILRTSLQDVERILHIIKQNQCQLLIELVNDQYGNYVVQHLFQRSNEFQKDGLIKSLEKVDPTIFNSYGNSTSYQKENTSCNSSVRSINESLAVI